MSNTKLARIWRRADVPEDVARAGINLRYPPTEGWVIKSFAKESREDESGAFDAFVAELEKTAAPFPPTDDAADKGDDDLPMPEPETDEPEEKPEHKEHGDSQVLKLLHQIVDALGLSSDGGDDPMKDLSKSGDDLPPPAKPLPTMAPPGGAPHNLPAFAHADVARIAKQRFSYVEVDDVGQKISELVTEVNDVFAPFNREVTQINRGTVKGRRLIRAKVEIKR